MSGTPALPAEAAPRRGPPPRLSLRSPPAPPAASCHWGLHGPGLPGLSTLPPAALEHQASAVVIVTADAPGLQGSANFPQALGAGNSLSASRSLNSLATDPQKGPSFLKRDASVLWLRVTKVWERARSHISGT